MGYADKRAAEGSRQWDYIQMSIFDEWSFFIDVGTFINVLPS